MFMCSSNIMQTFLIDRWTTVATQIETMAVYQKLLLILIIITYPSDGFPPDALTGSASYAKHHAEITRISIHVAVGTFIKENNLTVVDDSIDVIDLVDVFFGNDTDGLQEFSRREEEIIQTCQGPRKSDTAYIHCNSEQIQLVQRCLLIETDGDIDKGKCGFGGSSDTENGQRTAVGGINKDRPDSRVAYILTNEGKITDLSVIQAALLHDTVEDTETTLDEIKEEFGDEVADKNAPHKSLKAKLVKLADKLYNLRDLKRATPEGWSEERVQEYFVFAFKVVAGLRGINDAMEKELDKLFKEKASHDLSNIETEEEEETIILRPRSKLSKRPSLRKPVSPRRSFRYRKQNDLENKPEPQNQGDSGVYDIIKVAIQDMTGQVVSAIQNAFTGITKQYRHNNASSEQQKHAKSITIANNSNSFSKVRKSKPSFTSNSNLDFTSASECDESDDEIFSDACSDIDTNSIDTDVITQSKRSKSKIGFSNAKLPSFTGKEKWEVWIDRFEAVANLQNWDNRTKLGELLTRLQGEAGDFVFDQLNSKTLKNYSKLATELKNRFGVFENKKAYKVQFNRRTQKIK
ncbi:HDDC3 [Mytilus edulis]|uniref:HDDC3 n=1 Tax=Mytilus edulis TaxID=6550 RepID=A0A8S3U878_MYTED|nr:HDDC3 [Mytilus edulis]